MRKARPAIRWAALLFCLLALGVRLIVPAGFMPVREGGRTLIVACSGHGPMAMAGMAMPGAQRGHKGDHKSDDPDCGFGAIADTATGGAALPLLLLALAFLFARALLPRSAPPIRAAVRLRPPLRAPPAGR